MTEEEWRPISGHPGYFVSSLGNVLSHRQGPPKLLRPVRKKRHGYYSVNLSLANVVRTRTVHSLVAEAFIGPRPPGLEVLHGDGNQLNNAASNLRYGTHAENMDEAARHGVLRAPQQTCRLGHPIDRLAASGKRWCGTCDRARKVRNRASAAALPHAARP